MSVSNMTGPIPEVGPSRSRYARTLGAIVEQARWSGVLRKCDVGCGDQVIVRTRNSIYSLWAMGDGTFAVTGGWFDKQRTSPAMVGINGCTYGGSVIRHDVVAGAGLFLEFGNNVSTTRIKDVRVVRHCETPEDAAPASLPC